jgi:hypothetical protein
MTENLTENRTENRTGERWRGADGEPIDEEDRGLVYDIRTLIDRRRVLGIFGGIATASLLAACSSGGDATPSSSAASTTPSPSGSATADTGANISEIPDETGGPFPGDGSNGVNVLDDSGIVRSDIRSSFGSSTTTTQGVPLTIRLRGSGCVDRRRARRRGRLPLALQPQRRVLALRKRRAERELPPRRSAGRRHRRRDVHVDLPGLLLGTLAAHPFRERVSPATWSSVTTAASTRSPRRPGQSRPATRAL